MYAFGMVVLLGLAVLVVAKIGNHYLRQIPGAWAATLVALGVGAAWLTNLNLFSIWSIPVRNSDIAVTLTGILIAGPATAGARYWACSAGCTASTPMRPS